MEGLLLLCLFGVGGEKGAYFDPMEDKVYRHPTFYELPKSLDHM